MYIGRELNKELYEIGQVAASLCPDWMPVEKLLALPSVVTVCGAIIVYWMLISNFIYNTGLAIISKFYCLFIQ